MTKSLYVVLAMALLAICSTAQAETLYVAERMLVSLRAEAVDTSPVVKTVESGKPLEVLQRQDSFVQVRDPKGTEGWIEARYLTPDPPARLQLTKLQDELTKSRAQAAPAPTPARGRRRARPPGARSATRPRRRWVTPEVSRPRATAANRSPSTRYTGPWSHFPRRAATDDVERMGSGAGPV